MVRIKTKSKVTVAKKPVKAGSTRSHNSGGIMNAKVVAIVRKKKEEKSSNKNK